MLPPTTVNVFIISFTFINICSLCGWGKVRVLVIGVSDLYGDITGARLLGTTSVSCLDLNSMRSLYLISIKVFVI